MCYTVLMTANPVSTKDAVAMLFGTGDAYLSGEALSAHLNVSRAAVNAAVMSLRKDGYVIESSTRLGYRLVSAPDLFTRGEIGRFFARDSALPAKDLLRRMSDVAVYDTLDSTNRVLTQLALDGAPDGQIVIADCQTAGRGRLGRSFSSPAGMGIYFSCLIRPKPLGESLSSFTPLTSRTAVAVCRAIKAVCGVMPAIKWVNDLYLGPPDALKKICGILTQMDVEPESAHVRHIVIGIGLNVLEQTKDFPEELREIAGSLFSATGVRYSRAQLAAQMILQMERLRLGSDKEAAEDLCLYRDNCLLTGKHITVSFGEDIREALACDIGDDYGLRVRFEDGTEKVLHGGEVTVRPH